MCATRGWEHATPSDTRHRRSLAAPAKSKYHAQPTVVDGIRFDSKRESQRYTELKMLMTSGKIQSLYLQPSWDLCVGESMQKIGRYVADFSYTDSETGKIVVEDVKGVKTPLYRWKKKHVEMQYGIEIQEIH